jgi:hypothetical protein
MSDFVQNEVKEEPKKNKRGRKPKSEMNVNSSTTDCNASNVSNIVKNTTKPKLKSVKVSTKRNVYNINDKIENSIEEDDENIIMKLNINSVSSVELIESSMCVNNSMMLNGYDECKNYSNFECVSQASTNFDFEEPCCENVNSSLKIVHLLKDFEEKNKQNEWPMTTSIACYWCCHQFNNAPFGIPVKYKSDKFFVYGCFCSLECASSYNFEDKSHVEEMWERYSLINFLSRTIGFKNVVKPAPSRLCLKLFGGQMNIEEFRSYTKTNKLVSVNFPPMMTIVQQLEEINESDINSDFKYIPLDTERIKKYKDELKLKRLKPINNYKNTLDHAMNLKIVT